MFCCQSSLYFYERFLCITTPYAMGGEPIVRLATVRTLPRFNGHFLRQNEFPGFKELNSSLNHSGIVCIGVNDPTFNTNRFIFKIDVQ